MGSRHHRGKSEVWLERWLIRIGTLVPENLGSSPSTIVAAYTYVTLVLRDLAASSGLYRHQTSGARHA